MASFFLAFPRAAVNTRRATKVETADASCLFNYLQGMFNGTRAPSLMAKVGEVIGESGPNKGR
jgi:hypothetical protein